MILIHKEKLNKHTTVIQIDKIAVKDIYLKKPLILNAVKKTINDYKNMVAKKKRGLDLNSEERFLLNRSTLINFHDILKI